MFVHGLQLCAQLRSPTYEHNAFSTSAHSRSCVLLRRYTSNIEVELRKRVKVDSCGLDRVHLRDPMSIVVSLQITQKSQ
jgi:hypothetical protein